jgi:hypothetical protein
MDIFTRKNRTKIIFLLLLTLGLLSACSNKAQSAAPVKEPPAPPDKVEVVYFYDSKICECQVAPGQRMQSTLFINFGGELASGKLIYLNIDLNDTNNADIIAKYGATEQSLFISVIRADNEQIIPVPEILLVKDDDDAIDRLIINRVTRYLSGEE